MTFHVNFRIIVLNYKALVGILIGIVLNFYINLGRVDLFTLLSLPVHEYDIFIHLFRSCFLSFITSIIFSCIFQHVNSACFLIYLRISVWVFVMIAYFYFDFQVFIFSILKYYWFCMLIFCPANSLLSFWNHLLF